MSAAVNTKSAHDEQVETETLSLLDHLMELRKLLVRCAVAVLIGFVAAYAVVREPLMAFIIEPIKARGIEIIYTAVSEAFATQFRTSIVAGVVMVSPFLFYSMWAFIKPALYDNEIRLFRGLFFCALVLFLAGVVFCYTCVYNLAISFFITSGEDVATPMLSLDKYVSFLFSFILPFGVAFELPVALFIAARMGWANYAGLAKARKYVFFGIFVVAAILTPPDVVSQVMLGLPMYLLYEIGIQVARHTKPRVSPDLEDEAEA